MKIIFTIQNTSGQPAKLFNARTNAVQVNCGNVSTIYITVAVVADYVARYGATTTYWQFLADCYKHAFLITAINGKPVAINPFKDEFLTSETTLSVELNNAE